MSLQTKGVILAIISAICYGMNPLEHFFIWRGLNVNSVIFIDLFLPQFYWLFYDYQKDSFYLKFKERLYF